MMARVSVIIAAYNMAEYLSAAIDSALAQELPDTEIIVLDDGSTDSTDKVVRAYGSRVRYHRQPNQGVAAAYNRLLELAEGEYVHFLDADDMLAPGALAHLADLLDNNPGAGLAYGAADVMDRDGRVFARRDVPRELARRVAVPSEVAFKHLLRGCHITTSTVMVRRSVLDVVQPFQAGAVPGEDWDMWLRIAAEFGIACTPETVCSYRVHGSSITSAYNTERVLRSHLFTLGRLFSPPNFRFAHHKGYAYACLDRTLSRVAARGRDRGGFAARFFASLRKSPRLAFERETIAVAWEGLKAMLPAAVVSAGRRVRRGLILKGSRA
jgi:glycosyltransferase involved in cell wall biosynthesis